MRFITFSQQKRANGQQVKRKICIYQKKVVFLQRDLKFNLLNKV